MFFGLTPEKLLLIGVLAAFLIGPERLPRYAEALARFVSRARDFLRGAQSRVRDEMGPDYDDVDWRKLDPRQYDPRRIIREALLDDAPLAAAPGTATSAIPATDTPSADVPAPASPGPRRAPLENATFAAGDSPPFDTEAT